ncbi:DUF805 domain-containing protein [Campylobacter hyointestinalis]|nr:DUF805 domain-containing protein [Campylobacter hyointestinalis]
MDEFFEFNGVSSRKEFWIPVLINTILLTKENQSIRSKDE